MSTVEDIIELTRTTQSIMAACVDNSLSIIIVGNEYICVPDDKIPSPPPAQYDQSEIPDTTFTDGYQRFPTMLQAGMDGLEKIGFKDLERYQLNLG